MEKKKYMLRGVVIASSQEEAMQQFLAIVQGVVAIPEDDYMTEAFMWVEGLLHPDGEVRACGLPPAGYFAKKYQSEYDGNHPDCHADEELCLAFPDGVEAPERYFYHGSRSKPDWGMIFESCPGLRASAFAWLQKGAVGEGEWLPFDEYLSQEG